MYEARRAAVQWKEASSLPDSAKRPAPHARRPEGRFPFCLPAEHASSNVLAEARVALEIFRRDDIAWHDSINEGPSNHLLDSQVQCVNALAPVAHDPAAIKLLFGSVVNVVEVLPFFADDSAGDLVVFEWIGAADYLSERSSGTGRRGSKTTSADAAIRYRTGDGSVEIALIEWKYTEEYHGHELVGGTRSNLARQDRYRTLFEDPAGPVRQSLIPYSDLFVEPFYQLLRLTLLADQMEQFHEQGAERVRVVYVAPGRNDALWTSLNRESHQELASKLVQDSDPRAVEAIWSALCRRPDRFVFLDSATFVAHESPTSDEFRSRYGHLSGNAGFVEAGRRLIAAPVTVSEAGEWSELSWDGPWAALLPAAWACTTGASGILPVPNSPVQASRDPSVEHLAWWTPLPHLLAYSFGWSDLAQGLEAWQHLGRPYDDSRLEVIDTWWGEAAIGLAHWLRARRGDSDAAAALARLATTHDDTREHPLPAMLEALAAEGSDPLHLFGHAPVEPREFSYADDCDPPTLHIDASRTSAVMTFERYEGWYEWLSKAGHDDDGDQLAGVDRVDILSREVGWLGRYRRSPVTGRWFAGSHRLHLFGHP